MPTFRHNYTLVDITGNVTTWGHFGAVEITGFLLVVRFTRL